MSARSFLRLATFEWVLWLGAENNFSVFGGRFSLNLRESAESVSDLGDDAGESTIYLRYMQLKSELLFRAEECLNPK
jgi:hypothetical protein